MSIIGIDAHAIGERLTGNETYIANLIDAIGQSQTDHEFLLFFTCEEAAKSWRQKDPYSKILLVKPRQPLLRIPFVMPWLIRQNKVDLLHVQYVGPPYGVSPIITTIHDISYEHHPEYFTRQEVAQFRSTIPRTARKAALILTVSEYSKRDIVETYKIPDEKIIVTYNGVGSEFIPVQNEEAARNELQKRYGINRQYFLAVGNLQPRKNLVRLFEAYGRLRKAHPDIKHQLVVVGKKAWMFDPILSSVEQSNWERDIILTDYVPQDDLPMLYGCATSLVYPSVFEGFGLPPVEAMACGTPVIVSDRSALPEIVGDAGVKVNPFNIDEIAAAMGAMALDPNIANSCKVLGLERAKKFTWAECARKTLSAYNTALEGVQKPLGSP